jgi:hypothetical protein
MNRKMLFLTLLLATLLLGCSSSAKPVDTFTPEPSDTPETSSTLEPSPAQQQPSPLLSPSVPATVPVTAQSLVGHWGRVLTSNMAIGPHYWLRLTPEGTFALTVNKMQFDTNVNHMGTYSLEGDLLTLNAEPGSQKCEGQSATYQAIMYEDRTLEFRPIDVPCEQWLNMGAGRLGEGTIWVKLDD